VLCYDVYKNGSRVCRAGVGDAGVLTVILSWVASEGRRRRGKARFHCDLHVGGLYHPKPNVNSHVRWPDPKLHVGDELLVRVIEAEDPDVPTSTTVDDAAETERMQREYYEELKRQFEPERSAAPPRKKRPGLKRKAKPTL
jgi:hypothetical protein